MKHIYLAGKISDPVHEEANKQKFMDKATELRARGFKVFNPVEEEPPNKSWEFYIADDLLWMFRNKPDIIYLMKGWEDSRGAKIEHEAAIILNMEIIYE